MARKNPSMDPLLADFQALVQDTEKLLQQSASLAGDQAEGLRAQLQGSLARAQQPAGRRGVAGAVLQGRRRGDRALRAGASPAVAGPVCRHRLPARSAGSAALSP